MKKIFTVLGVFCVAAVASAQNLVSNPTFDNGLTGWAAGPSQNYGVPTLVAADGHNGSNSAQYQGATATTGFYQEIPVTAGTIYTISFWYKATGDGTDARIWSNYKDAAGAIIYQNLDASSTGPTTDPLRGPMNGYLPTSSVWTQHTVTVTAPANVTLFQLAVRAYNNSTVAAFDDFSVTTGSLAVSDFSKSKYSLVKNTLVKSELAFGKDAKDVKIYNMFGQVVKTASVKANSTLEVSDLAKGAYIVTGTVNNEAVSQKILKD